jgi:hypothetical protein
MHSLVVYILLVLRFLHKLAYNPPLQLSQHLHCLSLSLSSLCVTESLSMEERGEEDDIKKAWASYKNPLRLSST